MGVVLVDGSNVAQSDAWVQVMQREREQLPHANVDLDVDPRARLTDWIVAWRTHSGSDVVLVFDGQGPQGTGRRALDHGFLVIGSGSECGDSAVETEAARLAREGRTFRLVTNDRVLANVAGAQAAAVMSVEAFVAEVAAEPVEESGVEGRLESMRVQQRHMRIADAADDDTLAKLERMRRGIDPGA